MAGPEGPLSGQGARLVAAWWRAANYVSVGQIYLLDNPLLREPLGIEHVKPRLLGHWGTTPGLNLIYVHMNPAIRENGFLGVKVDLERNDDAQPDADVTAAGATVRTLVMAAREDLEIARQVRRLLR